MIGRDEHASVVGPASSPNRLMSPFLQTHAERNTCVDFVLILFRKSIDLTDLCTDARPPSAGTSVRLASRNPDTMPGAWSVSALAPPTIARGTHCNTRPMSSKKTIALRAVGQLSSGVGVPAACTHPGVPWSSSSATERHSSASARRVHVHRQRSSKS